MAKPTAQRVREAEASHRARGEREIRVWVPNRGEDIEAVRKLAARLCAEARAEQDDRAAAEDEDRCAGTLY